MDNLQSEGKLKSFRQCSEFTNHSLMASFLKWSQPLNKVPKGKLVSLELSHFVRVTSSTLGSSEGRQMLDQKHWCSSHKGPQYHVSDGGLQAPRLPAFSRQSRLGGELIEVASYLDNSFGETSKNLLILHGHPIGPPRLETVVEFDEWISVSTRGRSKVPSGKRYERIVLVVGKGAAKRGGFHHFINSLRKNNLTPNGYISIRLSNQDPAGHRALVSKIKRPNHDLLCGDSIGLPTVHKVTWYILAPHVLQRRCSLNGRTPTVVVKPYGNGEFQVSASNGFEQHTKDHHWTSGHMPRHHAAMYALVVEAIKSMTPINPVLRIFYSGHFHTDFFVKRGGATKPHEPKKAWLVEPVMELREQLALIKTVRLQRFSGSDNAMDRVVWIQNMSKHATQLKKSAKVAAQPKKKRPKNFKDRQRRRGILRDAMRSEKRTAHALKGTLVPLSGAGRQKGDVTTPEGHMVENKNTAKTSRRVLLSELTKLVRDAYEARSSPLMVIDVGGLKRSSLEHQFVLRPHKGSEGATDRCRYKSFTVDEKRLRHMKQTDGPYIIEFHLSGEFTIPAKWELILLHDFNAQRQT